MQKILLQTSMVILGGGIGSAFRYLVSKAFVTYHYNFPYHTFLINILGCFLYGLWFFKSGKQNDTLSLIHPFILSGLLGGFTTFSSFGFETFQMIQQGEWLKGFIYPILSVIAGILSVYLGFRLSG